MPIAVQQAKMSRFEREVNLGATRLKIPNSDGIHVKMMAATIWNGPS
jgi:hypothetical protein